MKTPLLIIKDHEELSTVYENTKTRLEFLQKRQDDLMKEVSQEKQKLWDGVEGYLKDKGLDDGEKKMYLCIENGVVYKTDKDDDPLRDILRSILE